MPILCLLMFIYLVPGLLWAEHIRGPVGSIITITQDSAKQNPEAVLKVGELGFIKYINPLPFHQGIELEITIPQELKNYGNAVEFVVYKNVDPNPDPHVVGYNGQEYYNVLLESSGRFFIQIPTKTEHNMISTSEAVLVSNTVSSDDFPLLFAFYPLGKGMEIPKSVTFSVKPRVSFHEMGGLSIKVVDENSRPVRDLNAAGAAIEVDGSPVSDINKVLYLKSGFHKLSLSSKRFHDKQYTFGIEKGTIHTVTISLIPALSKLNIKVPSQGILVLDGKKIEHNSGVIVPVQPGEHTVSLKTDKYTLSKTFVVQAKTNYTITFALDVIVSPQEEYEP
ncbi:MAG: hypothetical protein ACLFST_06885 [Spirochaetia bacterium]